MNHQFKQNKADEYYTKEYAILYELEAYYQKLFSANGKNGLNCFINSDKDYDFLKYKKRRDEYIEEEKINFFCIKNKDNFKKTNDLIDSILF